MLSHTNFGMPREPMLAKRPWFMEPLASPKAHPHKDGAPRASKHRRSQGQSAQAVAAHAAATTAALKVRQLALTHTPPPPGADDQAMLEELQFVDDYKNFITGTTPQGLAVGAIAVGAGGATTALVARAAGTGTYTWVFVALTLLNDCVNIYNANVDDKTARAVYLNTLIVLAENQRLRDDIQQRAQDGAARPEDAALLRTCERVIDALQTHADEHEAAYFHDAQSPHVQQARQELEALAQKMVSLKREYDGCGERWRQLLAQLEAPGLSEAQRTGLRQDIEDLAKRRATLVKDARALRKQMKGVHSPRRMKRALEKSLDEARTTLNNASYLAKVRAAPYPPHLQQHLWGLRQQRRALLLPLLQQQPWPADLPPLDTELLERWDAEMLPDEVVAALDAALAQIKDPALQQIDHDIAVCERGLQMQQDDQKSMAALQEKVRALEQDLKRLDRGLGQIAKNPFGDRGPAALETLRNKTLPICQDLFEGAAMVNTAGIALQLFPALVSSLYPLLPAMFLGLVMGWLDVQGGKRGMASAAEKKLPLIVQANLAALQFQACSRSGDPEQRSLQYAWQAQLELAAQLSWAQHLASQYNKSRKAYGSQAIFIGAITVLTALLTLATGVPFVLGSAVPGGAIGAVHAARVTKHIATGREQKHDRKARETVKRAFVKRFGVEGIAELQRDLAAGYPGRWDERLDGLRRDLRASKSGRGIDPQLLHPHALATNTPMVIERLTQALLARARDQRVGTPSAEAELVATLAQTMGKDDPSGWTLDGFASEQAYEQAVRTALEQLFGWTPEVPKALRFKDPRELRRVATRTDFWIARQFSQRNAVSDRHSFLGWVRAVAQNPQRFGDLLASLSPAERQRLREQVAHLARRLREEGIGPRELLALQAASVLPVTSGQEHPLKDFPQLRKPEAQCLLELMANPSWLAEPGSPAPVPATTPASQQAAVKPVAPVASASTTPDGAELVKLLIKSVKAVGRLERGGAAVHRPSLPRTADDTAPPRSKRARRGLPTPIRALRKHLFEHLPNPLSTPAKALDRMQEAKSDAELQALLQQILLEFAREVSPEGDFVLKQDPKVMATLPTQVDPAEVDPAEVDPSEVDPAEVDSAEIDSFGADPTQIDPAQFDHLAHAKRAHQRAQQQAAVDSTAVKRAHLRALLQTAGQTAGQTAANIEAMTKDRPHEAKELLRVAKRMKDTQLLCATLNNQLLNDKLDWGPTLRAISVS